MDSQLSIHHLLIQSVLSIAFKCHLYHILRLNIHLTLYLYLSITVQEFILITALFSLAP